MYTLNIHASGFRLPATQTAKVKEGSYRYLVNVAFSPLSLSQWKQISDLPDKDTSPKVNRMGAKAPLTGASHRPQRDLLAHFSPMMILLMSASLTAFCFWMASCT
ncbi:hypothetical protein, partial [Escherichia coli]|uniref:hypothetical protein n=1 Tax=Escherichia coli TaxID=562 RepID=UPI001963C9D1